MALAKRKPGVTESRKVRALPERPKVPVATLLRMFVLGSVAVLASVYAIWRYYTVPYQKMLVPAPAATEIEVEPPP